MMYRKKKILLLLLASAALGWLLVLDAPQSVEVSRRPVITDIDVSKAQTLAEKLPPEFPGDIPLEGNNILTSSSAAYPAPGRTDVQMMVTYSTQRTAAQKYAEYLNYLTAAGYKILERNPEAGFLYGTKDDSFYGNDFSVTITGGSEASTRVILTYLKRQ